MKDVTTMCRSSEGHWFDTATGSRVRHDDVTTRILETICVLLGALEEDGAIRTCSVCGGIHAHASRPRVITLAGDRVCFKCVRKYMAECAPELRASVALEIACHVRRVEFSQAATNPTWRTTERQEWLSSHLTRAYHRMLARGLTAETLRQWPEQKVVESFLMAV